MQVYSEAKKKSTSLYLQASGAGKLCYLAFLSFFLQQFACTSRLPLYPLHLDKSFRLKSHEGKVFQSKDLHSKISLLFFGFTRCPSVCPENLKRIQRAQDFLGLKKTQVQSLMISLDPEYDSPQVLKKYLSSYKMNVLGLWCKNKELEHISKKFGASFLAAHGEQVGHFIQHSSHIFLLDKKAQLRYIFRMEDSPQKIASIIRRL